jgi:hypothetical protein
LICQLGPLPGIKTHSSPAAFPTTLSLSFCSLPLSHLSCTAPSCLRPRRAPLTPLLGPLVPQNRYDAASGKNVAARRLTLIRSTSRQHCLVDRLARRPLTVTTMKRPATWSCDGLRCRTPPCPPIHHTSCLHRGRPRPRQHADCLRHRCVTTTSSCRRSPLRLGLVKRVIGLGTNCAATKPMENHAPLKWRSGAREQAQDSH